ncbi:unnamed protein product [Rotaria socialis]
MVSNSFIVFVSLFSLSGVFSNIVDFDCFERADTGMGRAYFEVYAWQASNRTCTKFVYGGALGNRNRFEDIEECYRSCHDAVLNHQLDFNPTRRYTAVNRLYENIQLSLNIEHVDNGYFKLILSPFAKVLGITDRDVSLQIFNNNQTQHWDIIPTGETNYFRIKTRTRPFGHFEYMFLQVIKNDTVHLSIDRRANDYLGQQWRFF